jgi:hypothetical protein
MTELQKNSKTALTISSLRTLPLPVEMYPEQRIAEFDAVEAELASVLARKKQRAR